MKTLLPILFSVLLTSFQYLYSQSSVVFRLETGMPFGIMLNGQDFPGYGATQKLDNVNPGRNQIMFYQVTQIGNGARRNRMIIYEGLINVNPSTVTYYVLDRFNQLRIENQVSLFNPYTNPNQNPYVYYGPYPYNWNQNPWNMNPGNWCPMPNPNPNPNPSTIINPTPPVNVLPVMTPMDPNMFQQVSNSIQRTSFESSKLSVATQVLRSNFLSAQQIINIMNLFSFESTKLDFAKQAYDRCVDPQNYFLVNNAFTYSSSISDLQDFLNHR